MGSDASVPAEGVFDLELVSEQSSLDFSTIIGKNVTIRVQQADHTDRFFNGIVSRFSQGAGDAVFTTYHAQVVPWLWLLTRTTDCRIFQQMTVPDILNMPPGCKFSTRCSERFEPCFDIEPPLIEAAPRHWVRCHLHDNCHGYFGRRPS